MGKSSLMVRTARRLEEAKITPITIDLQGIGTKDIKLDGNYSGIEAERIHKNLPQY